MTVEVDPDGLLDESNESNNASSLTTLQPDLTVTDIQAVTDATGITVIVTVRNEGPTPTGTGASAVLRIDDPNTGREVGMVAIPALAPLATADVSIRIDDARTTLGTAHRAFLTIDDTDVVAEEDEANNVELVMLNPYLSWQNRPTSMETVSSRQATS